MSFREIRTPAKPISRPSHQKLIPRNGRDVSMNSNQKLSYAIAAILSGSGACMSISYAEPPVDTAAVESEGIQEIVVTAQRRDESIQNVPITIQAHHGRPARGS